MYIHADLCDWGGGGGGGGGRGQKLMFWGGNTPDYMYIFDFQGGDTPLNKPLTTPGIFREVEFSLSISLVPTEQYH